MDHHFVTSLVPIWRVVFIATIGFELEVFVPHREASNFPSWEVSNGRRFSFAIFG